MAWGQSTTLLVCLQIVMCTKVAVHNNIAIKFLFKKNIWAKYWWRILYFYHSIQKCFKNINNHFALPNMLSFTVLCTVALNMVEQRPLEGSKFMSNFPQFWNPLWPRLQRCPPDGDVSRHFQILAEPLLAGFWHRWYFFGWFPAILNIPMQMDITKSD